MQKCLDVKCFTNKDIHERFDGVKEAIHQQIQARQRQKQKQKQPTTAEAVPRPSKGGQGNEETGATFDHLITLHQPKLAHLQTQKKALLQQMFV